MLDPSELLASEIIANATMNRGRGLSGVNSYQKELRFDIAKFLQSRVETQGQAVWYDACCGEGRALAEAARQFGETDWGRHVRLIGSDLIDRYVGDMPARVQWMTGDVTTLSLDVPADLVTCVHGLHYLGDKLGFLENVYEKMAPGGIFLGHLDAANVRLPRPWARLLGRLRARGVDIKSGSQRLQMTKSSAPLKFGVTYEGATVSGQPNYTGITVIDSWYRDGQR
jgi:SAM-dependent methyltransferase